MLLKKLPFSIFVLSTHLIMSKSFGKTQEIRKILKKNKKLKMQIIKKNKGSILYLEESSVVPDDWYKKDYTQNNMVGISLEKSYEEYPKIDYGKEVIVAVIDSGIDINHEELQGKIWINTKEIPNNNIDDDNNGYVDDIVGWNFLGSRTGHSEIKVDKKTNVATLKQKSPELQLHYDSLEITRELKRLLQNDKLNEKEELTLKKLRRTVHAKYTRAKNLYDSYYLDIKVFNKSIEVLNISNKDSLTIAEVNKIDAQTELQKQAKKTLKDFLLQGIDHSYLEEQAKMYQVQYEAHYNVDFNERESLIKDSKTLIEKGYGNNNVIGPDSVHGTHIAGIIAANRENNIGIKGISNTVKIMPIRAIPDGDERDKDVINAIYYAVDNGAKIINMSFGKYISPNKKEVKDALQYAKEHGVLIVQAAGNDYLDIDVKPSFPNPLIAGKKLPNYITVGSSSPDKDETVVSSFSNYGKKSVDILAPGFSIYSTLPNNAYASMSGTSMAAPMVSGIAAVLLSQNPNFSPEELKRLIIDGSTQLGNIKIFKPGIGSIRINKILSNAGVVNLFNTLELYYGSNLLALNTKFNN